MMKKFMYLSFLFSISLNAFSQDVLDGVYPGERNRTRMVIPYDPIAEHDVMWMKRVWRVMDMRQKMNHKFYYPIYETRSRKSLIQTIRNGFYKNELTAFDAMSDEFTISLSSKMAFDIGTSIDTIPIENEFGEIEMVPIVNEFQNSNVIFYRVKEDWYFDRQTSTLNVRIIGICPVTEKYDENGEFKGTQPLYWLYFPELRYTLAKTASFNEWNKAEPPTYDDLFQKRFFSSYVYQESNVYGRKIKDYKNGIESLLEGKKIEANIFNFEQDLWEY